ncbi:MAG TPA: DNA polymerase III subunit gamma/tau C-terminal domain-containing protein, partial [Gammaproteobacteria bacterium]|nr:DNA polymerase III subunit gamma/tau C-terminal domain-containing protein [Gammaproteobacteria bacterium]
QIQGQLEHICEAEHVEADPDGLRSLAHGAEGSMRDALSLLDQAIAFGGGRVERDAVDAMLGTIDSMHLAKLLEALAAGDGSALMREVAELDEQAPNYSLVLDGLMGVLQRIAVMQLVASHEPGEEDPTHAALAASMSPEDVQLYYQIALQGRRDLAARADWRSAFEMTLLRMLAFRPAGAASGGDSTRGSGAVTKPLRAANGPARAVGERSRKTAPAGSIPPAEPAPAPIRRSAAPTEASKSWLDLLNAADVRGAARQLAENCVIRARSPGRIELTVASERAHLNTDQVRRRLESALANHLGGELSLSITPGQPGEQTPAEQRKANETQRMRKAREAIEQDPAVKSLQATFDAVVEADTIE